MPSVSSFGTLFINLASSAWKDFLAVGGGGGGRGFVKDTGDVSYVRAPTLSATVLPKTMSKDPHLVLKNILICLKSHILIMYKTISAVMCDKIWEALSWGEKSPNSFFYIFLFSIECQIQWPKTYLSSLKTCCGRNSWNWKMKNLDLGKKLTSIWVLNQLHICLFLKNWVLLIF